MARIESGKKGNWDWTRLSIEGASMEAIPGRGGLLSGWNVTRDGREYPILYLKPSSWDEKGTRDDRQPGGIPVLFPVCGVTHGDGLLDRYYVNGQPYSLGKHGFGPYAPWNLIEKQAADEEAKVVMEIRDDAETRKSYPFQFVCRIAHTLRADSLVSELSIENLSDSPMPMAPGLHPYFTAPLMGRGRRDDLFVETSATNEYLFDTSIGCWGGEKRPLADPTISLANWNQTSSRMFGDLTAPGYVLRDPNSDFAIKASWPAPTTPDGGPYLTFWTDGGPAPFFCVEPFMAPTNVLNHKHGLITVAPGQTWQWWFKLELVEG